MKKKALIIDDDSRIRENVVDLLMEEGFVALGAESGEQGVDMAVQEKPDVVICDIAMPGLDGYGVLGALRGRPETTGIPFVFLTANLDIEGIRRALSLGADAYVTKPFSNAELLRSVRAQIRA